MPSYLSDINARKYFYDAQDRLDRQRAANALAFNEFVKTQSAAGRDTSVKELERMRQSLSGGSSFLRGGLPARDVMGSIVEQQNLDAANIRATRMSQTVEQQNQIFDAARAVVASNPDANDNDMRDYFVAQFGDKEGKNLFDRVSPRLTEFRQDAHLGDFKKIVDDGLIGMAGSEEQLRALIKPYSGYAQQLAVSEYRRQAAARQRALEQSVLGEVMSFKAEEWAVLEENPLLLETYMRQRGLDPSSDFGKNLSAIGKGFIYETSQAQQAEIAKHPLAVEALTNPNLSPEQQVEALQLAGLQSGKTVTLQDATRIRETGLGVAREIAAAAEDKRVNDLVLAAQAEYAKKLKDNDTTMAILLSKDSPLGQNGKVAAKALQDEGRVITDYSAAMNVVSELPSDATMEEVYQALQPLTASASDSAKAYGDDLRFLHKQHTIELNQTPQALVEEVRNYAKTNLGDIDKKWSAYGSDIRLDQDWVGTHNEQRRKIVEGLETTRRGMLADVRKGGPMFLDQHTLKQTPISEIERQINGEIDSMIRHVEGLAIPPRPELRWANGGVQAQTVEESRPRDSVGSVSNTLADNGVQVHATRTSEGMVITGVTITHTATRNAIRQIAQDEMNRPSRGEPEYARVSRTNATILQRVATEVLGLPAQRGQYGDIALRATIQAALNR